MQKNIAMLGCGNISDVYLKNLTEKFDNVNVYAICDSDVAKAKAKAEQFGIDKILTFDEVLQDENVDIVLNITPPMAHYELCKKALEAKKNVYVEKPVSVTYAQGAELVELAKKNGVLFGCAPDTFMGAGLQTARKALDEGLIGDAVGAIVRMTTSDPESWHPNPDFFYKTGAGPLLDMGPYCVTALVNMLGAAESVSGMGNSIRKQRKITSQPNYGKTIEVEVPTHVSALVKFKNGAIGNIITSFDVYGTSMPNMEVYGTEGSMIVPDPNEFGGEVLIKQAEDEEFRPYPLISDYTDNCRGLGVADMAQCLIDGRSDLCASSRMALHVLEIMENIQKSSEICAEIKLETTCERPKMMCL